jgi:hypothetical protein
MEWNFLQIDGDETCTLTVLDSIVNCDVEGKRWLFPSIQSWILLFRVTMRHDTTKNERTVPRLIRSRVLRQVRLFISCLLNRSDLCRKENCLIENGSVLEYFPVELIQLEYNDIRQRQTERLSSLSLLSVSFFPVVFVIR